MEEKLAQLTIHAPILMEQSEEKPPRPKSTKQGMGRRRWRRFENGKFGVLEWDDDADDEILLCRSSFTTRNED